MTSNGLALPPTPTMSSEDTSTETINIDTFLQSNDFLDMIDNYNQSSNTTSDTPYADVDMSIFEPEGSTSANFNQMPAFGAPPPLSIQSQLPTPPAMEPNMWTGARYHPEVGWYFPAQPASGLSTPMPMISEGYTPAASMLPSLMPSGATTPIVSTAASKANNRRKYGPAAFLEDQARSRVEANRSAIDLPPTSESFQTNRKKDSHPLRDRKQPNIIQNCVCTDKEALKIKRPKNAFIIYRSHVSRDIIKRLGRNDNQAVSRIAGQMWRDVKDTPEGAKFFRLAAEESERHNLMYPGYKYRPGQSARNKFGSASCTCGAYAANLKALRESEGLPSDADVQYDYDEISEDDGAFIPPSSSRPAVLAAHDRAARAAAAQTQIPHLASLGLPAGQEAEAQAHIDALKRKRDATDALDDESDEPVTKRRSARNSAKSVNYADYSDGEIARPSTPVEGRKSRPSQAGLLSSPTMSHAAIRADSPARNTRSASLSRSQTASPDMVMPQADFTFGFGEDVDGNFTTSINYDWEKVFRDCGLTDYVQDADAPSAAAEAEIEDIGENITVTHVQPQPRTRGRSSASQASPTSAVMRKGSRKSLDEPEERLEQRRTTRSSKRKVSGMSGKVRKSR